MFSIIFLISFFLNKDFHSHMSFELNVIKYESFCECLQMTKVKNISEHMNKTLKFVCKSLVKTWEQMMKQVNKHRKEVDYKIKSKMFLNERNINFFLILTQFNTHYESMQDFIYCSERCASAAFFSHQKSLLSVLYTITVLNARTLWVCFFSIFSLFHLTLWWHHSLKLIQYTHWEYHLNDHRRCAHDF